MHIYIYIYVYTAAGAFFSLKMLKTKTLKPIPFLEKHEQSDLKAYLYSAISAFSTNKCSINYEIMRISNKQ